MTRQTRTVHTVAEADARFWAKVEKIPNGCWLWNGVMSSGVPGHFIHQGRRIQVRRKAWETFHGAVPAGHRLWVRCQIARCIRPALGHLVALPQGTRTPMPHGAAHHLAGSKQLTWQEVLLINGLACAGFSNARLQGIFAISNSTINAIVTKRRQWTWLTRYLPRAQRTYGGRRRADGSPPQRKPRLIVPTPVVAVPVVHADAQEEMTPEEAGRIFQTWQQRRVRAP